MKLEINTTPQNHFNHYNFSPGMMPEDTAKILNAGVQFAKDGNRAEARALLMRVTESEPKNESAWLWLASISEYPEELIVFLQRVLEINPENERALEWLSATKTLFAKTFVQHGTKALQENRQEFARQCFLQAKLNDPQNEDAWLELALMAESSDEKTEYLERVLSINSANERALSEIRSIKRRKAQQLLKKANVAAVSGNRETAEELLGQVFENTPDLEDAWLLKAFLAVEFNEKISCYEKVLQSNPDSQAAQAGLASLRSLVQEDDESELFEESAELNKSSDAEFSNGADSEYVSEAQNFQDEASSETFNESAISTEAEDSNQLAAENFQSDSFESQTQEADGESEKKNVPSVTFSDESNEETAEFCESFSKDTEEQKVAAVDSAGKPAGKYTIMIVDDSPTIRRLVSAKLEKSGHEVLEAASGSDALAKINEAKPDLILLDISMPEMDGYQVCKMIRGYEAMKEVPVLLISGKDGLFDTTRGHRAGSTGFINKPFGPETLMKTIETYLS